MMFCTSVKEKTILHLEESNARGKITQKTNDCLDSVICFSHSNLVILFCLYKSLLTAIEMQWPYANSYGNLCNCISITNTNLKKSAMAFRICHKSTCFVE